MLIIFLQVLVKFKSQMIVSYSAMKTGLLIFYRNNIIAELKKNKKLEVTVLNYKKMMIYPLASSNHK